MWRELSELTAVFLIGCAIKIMDDYLDREENSLARKLDVAALPYSLLLTVAAAGLAPYYSLPLFLASYSCGMTADYREKLPTGLAGWQESLLALVLSLCFFGWRTTASAAVVILFIQLLDDFRDLRKDRLVSRSNLVHVLGPSAAAMAMAVLAAWSCALDCRLFVLCLITLPLVEGVLQWGSTKL